MHTSVPLLLKKQKFGGIKMKKSRMVLSLFTVFALLGCSDETKLSKEVGSNKNFADLGVSNKTKNAYKEYQLGDEFVEPTSKGFINHYHNYCGMNPTREYNDEGMISIDEQLVDCNFIKVDKELFQYEDLEVKLLGYRIDPLGDIHMLTEYNQTSEKHGVPTDYMVIYEGKQTYEYEDGKEYREPIDIHPSGRYSEKAFGEKKSMSISRTKNGSKYYVAKASVMENHKITELKALLIQTEDTGYGIQPVEGERGGYVYLDTIDIELDGYEKEINYRYEMSNWSMR